EEELAFRSMVHVLNNNNNNKKAKPKLKILALTQFKLYLFGSNESKTHKNGVCLSEYWNSSNQVVGPCLSRHLVFLLSHVFSHRKNFIFWILKGLLELMVKTRCVCVSGLCQNSFHF